MPTIFYKFGLRFYFVSFDCSEPCHIHVADKNGKICKYWLRNTEIYLADNFKIIKDTFYEFCKNYK